MKFNPIVFALILLSFSQNIFSQTDKKVDLQKQIEQILLNKKADVGVSILGIRKKRNDSNQWGKILSDAEHSEDSNCLGNIAQSSKRRAYNESKNIYQKRRTIRKS